jgi:hypothetical protein
VGDSLIFLGKRNLKIKYILPYYSPCNYEYIVFLNRFIDCKRSFILKKFIGFFRHEEFVINTSYYINYVRDLYNFKKTEFYPKYLISEAALDCGNNLFESYKSYFSEKYLHNFVCASYRNGLANKKTEHLHSFRNSSRSTYIQILDYLSKKHFKIINISDDFINEINVLNIKFLPDYKEIDSILAIYFSDIFVGDASGPSTVAQILNVKSAIYNGFPPSSDVTNIKSKIIHKYVSNVEKNIDVNKITCNNDILTSGIIINDNSFDEIKQMIDRVLESINE